MLYHVGLCLGLLTLSVLIDVREGPISIKGVNWLGQVHKDLPFDFE